MLVLGWSLAERELEKGGQMPQQVGEWGQAAKVGERCVYLGADDGGDGEPVEGGFATGGGEGALPPEDGGGGGDRGVVVVEPTELGAGGGELVEERG